MIRLIYYISVFLLLTIGLRAQDKQYYLGPTIYYNSIFNKSEIPLYPYSADCGVYQSGNSSSISFGLNAGYVLIPDLLSIDAKILYDTRPIDLEKLNNTGLKVFIDNEYNDLVLRHNYKASIKYLMLDLGAKYYPLKNIPAGVRLGFDLSTEMFGNKYTNTESINSPKGILFPDETLQHEVESGELELNSTNYGINISIFGEYEQDTNFIIVPEISYRYQLNSNLKAVDWYSNMLRVGVSAVWYINLDKRPTEIPERNNNIVEKEIIEQKPEPVVFSNLEINPLKYTETIVTQTYPLLPYIFFDSASVELDDKITQKQRFTDELSLPKNNIDIYYYMPDILGSRLENNPKYRLTITGVTDGVEIQDSTERLELALNRAKSLKAYLVDNFDIQDNQIILKSKDLPERISSTEYSEGYEENRRIELSSNDPSLFNPVIHKQFSEIDLSSEDVYFEVDIENSENIEFLNIYILQSDSVIYSETQRNIKDKFRFYKTDIYDYLHKHKNYSIKLTARDSHSEEYTISKDIESSLKLNDYELARLNLIVFDFDSDNITNINQNYLNTFLSTQIAPKAKIQITGSTDLLGGYDYNKELSIRRANAVRKIVSKYAKPEQIVSCKGVGSDNLKFDINTPEGRFYCRTVLIEVMNPIE